MKINTLAEIAEELSKENSIIVSAHISPDSDAVGSSFALAYGLKSLGKKVKVYLSDPVPNKLKTFLGEMEYSSEIPKDNYDAFVVVDTASKKRVGEDFPAVSALAKRVYNIDHHVSNDAWADLNYIDGEASASAVIVWRLLKELKANFSPIISNLLYAGLMDDTGRFSFSNTNIECFNCAGDLLRNGAIPNYVANNLYDKVPLKVLKLQSLAISKLQFFYSKKLALIALDEKDLNSCGATKEDVENLVHIARCIEGVKVAIFQRRIEDGWKFSLRSKDESIDVNQIAKNFEGGGHKMAAGCKVSVVSAEEASKKIVAAFEGLLGA